MVLIFTLFKVSIFALSVNAAVVPIHSKHATHRVRRIGRDVRVEVYHPKASFKTYGKDGSPTTINSLFNSEDTPRLNDSAIAFASSELGMDASGIGYKAGYMGSVSHYAYLKQYHDGIPISNAVANVGIKGDKVFSFGSSFVSEQGAKFAPSTPTMNFSSVLPATENSLEGLHNGNEPSLEYLVRDDGSVALTHVFQIRNETTNTWYEAFVCAHTGELLSVTDFVAHASYRVVPIDRIAFSEGLKVLNDPEDLEASPVGWHQGGLVNGTTTTGNNVFARKAQVTAQQNAAGPTFSETYDDSRDPSDETNVSASLTNAFYIINTMHDFTYKYGFTEDAFNFQDSNFDKGGREGDAVQMVIQDASGVNNANFATPPDGQPGKCTMFVWTETQPNRDGAMENDILVHEMTHGITTRMTGGGTARCLQTLESGGLGEGWGDAMANWVSQTPDMKDFIMGQYVLGRQRGIRHFPYSTNPETNPLRYSDLKKLNEVHDIGEVWANMLHNVMGALVSERGFSANALTNPDGDEGNVVFMHLFIDSLALQPCNPTFVSARDAWMQADENRYNGANRCTLFNAFASRGLGLNAGPDFNDDTTVPDGC